MFNLTHIKGEHLKKHLLIVTTEGPDQAPDNIREHGAANPVLEAQQRIFIIPGHHIRNGYVQFMPQLRTCHTAVGGQDFDNIPVILQIVCNGNRKARQFRLNDFLSLFYIVKGFIIGGKPHHDSQAEQEKTEKRHKGEAGKRR